MHHTRLTPISRFVRGDTFYPAIGVRKVRRKSGTNEGVSDGRQDRYGASEGIRNLIGYRSHLANLLGISAFCDFCLTAITHQSERKRIGTGSNCAKTRTYIHQCRVIGGEGCYVDIASDMQSAKQTAGAAIREVQVHITTSSPRIGAACHRGGSEGLWSLKL